MPDANDNIEARLCAYIDGLLDEKQRQEIEQYLAQYPEHRKLIDELLKQRQMLRELPQESAPPDVLDHFQGRLERSVLLDDREANPGTDARRRRGPVSLVGIAAILLLSLGLAIIIWIALPPKRPNIYATNNSLPAPIAPPVEPTTRVERSARAVASSLPTPKSAAKPAAALPTRLICFISSTDPPEKTKQIREYLADNSFSYRPMEIATTGTNETVSQALLVEGITRSQAEDLMRSLTESVEAPQTKLAVTRPSNAVATTGPVVDAAPQAAINSLSALRTTMPTTPLSTATRPMMPASRPDEPAELFIVIQQSSKSPTTLPTTNPATQPTTAAKIQ